MNGRLAGHTVFVMAVACAFAVATIYYCQPLLPQMAAAFTGGSSKGGAIATLTQMGYACGLLLFVPLGDIRDPRAVVLGLVAANLAALLACAWAPSETMLLAACAATGMSAVSAQVIIPAMSGLAAPASRGQVVGALLSGLSAGLLFARTLSGFVGAHWGWRAMYVLAAMLDVVLFIVVWRLMPRQPRTGGPRYGALLLSLVALVKTEPVLRAAAATGLLLFACFSSLWTALAGLLADAPYHYGAALAGMFGLVGVAGLVASPFIGRLADRIHARPLLFLGGATVIAAFVILYFGAHHLALLVVTLVLLDVGNRCGLVANQARIYAARPDAKSRMNTVFMVGYFAGGALGAWLGTAVAHAAGWRGVALMAIALAFGAIVIHLFTPLRERA